MRQKINVLNTSGDEISADVLLYFSMENTGKEYILYTFGEKDGQNLETIYASTLLKNGDDYKLEAVLDEEWEQVKNTMREVIRNEGE